MARSKLLKERSRQLDISVGCGEGAKGVLNESVEGTRHETVGLTEHLHAVAALISRRLHPDAVLLVGSCGPGVLNA